MKHWGGIEFTGISEAEAAKRLQQEGYNELPSAKPQSLFSIALSVVREPMLLLLIAGGTIYLILGDTQEALMLMGFVLFIMGITFYQERKTERALEALRDLSSPRALVIRDGQERRIAGREVVREDVLVLAEGDRVPADASVISSDYIEIDESLVTGESVPVAKRAGAGAESSIFSGTLVVKGKCMARVESTGVNTALGRIGKSLQSLQREQTHLHRETGRMVRILATGGLVLCAAVVVIYGVTRMDWLNGFLAGIALAMAIMPEEFPVVLAVFLALGAWRMAQKNVLTRHVPAVEALGAATVLCVDKTGTLTENVMTVAKVYTRNRFYDIDDATTRLPETIHEIVEYSILASHKDPFDPMEKAFRHLGERYLANTEHLHDNWVLAQEYPLSQELLAMSHVWKSPDAEDYVIAAKGAPEAIADLCHFDEVQANEMLEQLNVMARQGLRVLAVAKAHFKKAAMPGEQHAFNFVFLGLIGLADPIRATVPDAIRQCHEAGIRIIMITGDYPDTARNIAQQIGLNSDGGCITGAELNELDDETLRQRLSTAAIFARVVPEQKLRLVEALKSNGEVVAMTGDGVNDAPALKSAHIGIAMGKRGTDVAREAADLVLLDDDFSSIVSAVSLGRRIFDNLKKAISYIIAVHVPIAGLSLLPVLFGWPLILMPVHIVFLELIIDPACSIVFEAEPGEKDLMRRRPRDPVEPLFKSNLLFYSVLRGLSVLMIVLGVFAITMYRNHGENDARAITFTTLVVANLGLILTSRSMSRTFAGMFSSGNRALWWVVGATIGILGLVLYLPGLSNLFHFERIHTIDLAVALGAGVASVLWFEILKRLRKNGAALQ